MALPTPLLQWGSALVYPRHDGKRSAPEELSFRVLGQQQPAPLPVHDAVLLHT
ncbi:hypothetical protein [Streptomyces fagopyri]|uniref:hypothetical protein n=1 Tax=Streptomyces fagopyri TaxID=2662397 RepID=UPI0033DF3632